MAVPSSGGEETVEAVVGKPLGGRCGRASRVICLRLCERITNEERVSLEEQTTSRQVNRSSSKIIYSRMVMPTQ